jgi:hypothetical protein
VFAESEVVIRSEVNDLLAVVGADWSLYVVKHAKIKVSTALFEFVQLSG